MEPKFESVTGSLLTVLGNTLHWIISPTTPLDAQYASEKSGEIATWRT